MTRSVPFYRPYFPAEKRRRIAQGIDAVLASGQLMMGPWKDRFEGAFAKMCGTRHAVSLNSATTGLQISLQHYGAADHDVLVPAGSFVTDVSAVMMTGARPVLVDLNPDTLALDLADLERKLTPRTKGIIWVHLTGIISHEYAAIQAFARDRGLFLIEDAAHAHGAEIDGRPAGSLGDVGVFSFYPTKVVTAGTGGMLTSDDDELAAYARSMRLFGKDEQTGDIVRPGNDWFLDEIRACVGVHQVEDLDDQLARRRAIAERYTHALTNQPGLHTLPLAPGNRPAWYHYTVFVDDRVDYIALAGRLKADHGIATKRIYKPTHHETLFRHLDTGMLKATEHALDRSLCLPLFVDLTDEEVDYVAEAVIAEVRVGLAACAS